MNTVTKFERFKTRIFNGQDLLKSHFISKNPIIYTTDMTEYSQATLYRETSEYVWFINPSIELSRGFPLWFKPPKCNTDVVYEFPYKHLHSFNTKSWNMVKLVPTTGIVNSFERKDIVCGTYDVYCGKKQFDMFYVGLQTDELFKELSSKYTNVTAIDNVTASFDLSTTDMFWIIPSGIKILDNFKFDFVPHERAYDYPHVFGNGEVDNYSGIVLMSKAYTPTDKELKYNFYVSKRIIKKIISVPA